jgi:hypothetical protein
MEMKMNEKYEYLTEEVTASMTLAISDAIDEAVSDALQEAILCVVSFCRENGIEQDIIKGIRAAIINSK